MNKILKLLMLLVLTATALARPAGDRYPLLPSSLKIRNVIVMIGDGMGIGQITAARISRYGAYGRLHFERMPVTGLINTCSADKLITESGASATALATGYKTNNNMVGVSPEGQRYKTILEACKENGMATGLIATSSITHATPASFAAHVANRGDEARIAEQLFENRVNVMLGGGRGFFLPESTAGSKRNDNRNLIKEAMDSGYTVISDKLGLMKTDAGRVLGLFQLGALNTDTLEPSLAQMTEKAIELLNDKNGFFIMIEGSQIDWGCHDNDVREVIQQTNYFDDAVKVALDFAAQDSHTLVIVLADHETGGLEVTGGSLNGEDMQVGWLSKYHTAAVVPVYAFGPGAEVFTGVHENTEIPRKIAKLMGLAGFAE